MDTCELAPPRPKVRKAVKWLGKGIGRASRGVWRAMRRARRRGLSRAPLASLTLIDDSLIDDNMLGMPFWSSELSPAFQLPQLELPVLQLPRWLTAPVQQLLFPAAPAAAHTAADTEAMRDAGHAAASMKHSNNSSSHTKGGRKRRGRRSSNTANSNSSCVGGSNTNEMAGSSDGFSVYVLAQMFNPANNFPMLLHTAEQLQQQLVGSDSSSNSEGSLVGSLQQHHHRSHGQKHSHHHRHHRASHASHNQVKEQQQDADAALLAEASSSSRQPQQLLTVGCRHWGNWWDGRGLLRVKIYDFAIYVDGQQAQELLPSSPLLLTAGTGQQMPQQQLLQSQGPLQSGDLPAVLKSSESGVGMSLVLKAARDVPLNLLAEEYEKVLRRRLDRVGGNAADVSALKQLLASFSDANRLPPVVKSSSSTSSSSTSSDGSGAATAGVSNAGPVPSSSSSSSGSVKKGAMIVFERNGGDVTARVGPVILGTVSSPKVAEALFDLYLGEQPVSKAAKEAAAQTLTRLTAATSTTTSSSSSNSSSSDAPLPEGAEQQQQPEVLPGYYLPSSRGQEIQCDGRRLAGRQGRRQASARQHTGQGLGIDELAACVLHMG